MFWASRVWPSSRRYSAGRPDDGRSTAIVIRARDRYQPHCRKETWILFVPDFTRRDVRAATTPEVLAHGQGLATHVEDLDWDEYSLWGGLPGEGMGVGELLVHHTGRPLTGECPCPDGSAAELWTAHGGPGIGVPWRRHGACRSSCRPVAR